MTDKIILIPQPIVPAGGNRGIPSSNRPKGGPSFEEFLSQSLDGSPIQFSRHAQQRIADRGIHFSPSDLGRLNEAVDQIRAKGGRDSLVLLNENALVVSVKNNQVVTVVDRENLKDNVFTNIDSAIIA